MLSIKLSFNAVIPSEFNGHFAIDYSGAGEYSHYIDYSGAVIMESQ